MGEALEYVDLGTNRTAVSITAGDSHTCAVLDDATLKVGDKYSVQRTRQPLIIWEIWPDVCTKQKSEDNGRVLRYR